MLKQALQKLVEDKKELGIPDYVILNYIKEYLQYPVLSYLYRQPETKNWIFSGGSCLRICFDLPRLSEDLDFDLNNKDYDSLDLNILGISMAKYFSSDYLIDINYHTQGKNRLYLKFPVLKEIGLPFGGGSDYLFVKIEPNQSQFEIPTTEISAISKYGYNFIVKRYSQQLLMTGKIMAILDRSWFKGDNNEVDIKGRDYYDLYWYLTNNIKPDYKQLIKLKKITDGIGLKKVILEKIQNNVTQQKLSYDLVNFFPDQMFISDFCKNYLQIIKPLLDNL